MYIHTCRFINIHLKSMMTRPNSSQCQQQTNAKEPIPNHSKNFRKGMGKRVLWFKGNYRTSAASNYYYQITKWQPSSSKYS